jgi:hypothetical protein
MLLIQSPLPRYKRKEEGTQRIYRTQLQASHLAVACETKAQTVDVGAAVAADMVEAQTGRAEVGAVDYCVAGVGMAFAKDHCLAVMDMDLCS